MDFPILSSLILLPVIGSLFIFFSKSNSNEFKSSKYIALFVSFSNFFLSLYLWYLFDESIPDFQFLENRNWLGFINYKVGIDGISILFVILTTFITPLCIISVNSTIKKSLKEFLIAILLMETYLYIIFLKINGILMNCITIYLLILLKR